MAFERPAPDLNKLLTAWEAWEKGEEMPGRVLANLKTAQDGIKAMNTGIVTAMGLPEGTPVADALAALKKADDGIPRTVAPVEEVQLFVRDASGTHDVTLRELESKTMGTEVTRADLQISVAGDGEIFLTTRQDGMIRTFVP